MWESTNQETKETFIQTGRMGRDWQPGAESTYKGLPIRLSADFSKETLQARRDWQEVFKVLKSNDLHPRLLCPAKLYLEWKGR